MPATDPRALALAPVFDDAPFPALMVSPSGCVLYANRGLKGEAGSTLLERNVLDLVAPEHAERVRVALTRAAKENASDSFELGERGPAGTIAWWRGEASPVAGTDAVFLLFTDLTAHKREHERLRRVEELMVDAQGIAHLGTWDWDVSQPHATWSGELYRIYGLTPEEYTPSYDGYLRLVHPDDRERVMRVTEACFKEHKPYSHDERIFRKGGEMRWLHTWAVPVLDEHGTLVRLLGVCQDVTETKRAESAMRAQMLTRGLARRLLHDLIRRANVSEQVVRDLGRGLAKEPVAGGTPEAYALAFADMGFGALRFEGAQNGRYVFTARDLLERTTTSTLPTCFMALGYLEGVVSGITGRAALGTEMRCQSMGHDECRFVVQ